MYGIPTDSNNQYRSPSNTNNACVTPVSRSADEIHQPYSMVFIISRPFVPSVHPSHSYKSLVVFESSIRTVLEAVVRVLENAGHFNPSVSITKYHYPSNAPSNALSLDSIEFFHSNPSSLRRGRLNSPPLRLPHTPNRPLNIPQSNTPHSRRRTQLPRPQRRRRERLHEKLPRCARHAIDCEETACCS